MDTIYFLTEYNWKPGELIPSKSVKNYKIKDSFGRIVMIPKEKCAFPDELVCVVWEMWKGRNGRGGYRVERQLYPEHRIAANMIERQNEFNLHGRVVKNSPALLKGYVRPIELAINDFAVEVLKGLESTLIDDSEKEVERLRGEVRRAISAIEGSGDDTAMSILKAQMDKLKSVENITSPMEGVVFLYKGNAYKFTGSFASANQILGLFKYGRKGTKL